MTEKNTPEKREVFNSSFGFILAMAGSAIGLGNIWKFPYITGMNGGGAFVLIYLISIIIVGIPIMASEMALGRKTHKNPYGAFAQITNGRNLRSVKILSILISLAGLCFIGAGDYALGVITLVLGILFAKMGFKLVGFFQVIVGGILIMSYYSLIGGWAVIYTGKSFLNSLNYNTQEQASEVFSSIATNLPLSIGFQLLFLIICALILAKGVRKGIEKWSKILMPILAILLLILIVRNLFLEGSFAGVEFFLKPDFSKVSTAGILEALGHSFYTLSLGMGIVITYGSYLSREQNLIKSCFLIVIFDTIASIMAGLAIFPAVFAMGFNPAGGPTLIFELLPAAFNSIPGGFGFLWSGIFFVSLTLAAITSAISLLENPISFLIDELKMSRKIAILITITVTALLGLLVTFSISNWDNIIIIKDNLVLLFPKHTIKSSFFELIDYIASSWILPISGFFTALFVAWVWGTKEASKEINNTSKDLSRINIIDMISGLYGKDIYKKKHRNGLTIMSLWAILIRYFVPFAILVIFINGIL